MNEEVYAREIERTMNGELTEKEKLSMLAMGLAGEVGELVDQLKKHIFHGHELDLSEFTKELGDIEWYKTHLMKHFDIKGGEVRQKNVEKLQKRYKQGFSEEDSINRIENQIEGND